MSYNWQQHVPDSAKQFIPDKICTSKSKCSGTDKGEFIVGNSKPNTIDGKGGNDAIAGDSGNDTLIGGSGNDHLAGDLGNNKLSGNGGNDKFFFQLKDGKTGFSEITDYGKGDKIVVKGKIYKNMNAIKKGKDTLLTYKGKDMALIRNASVNKNDVINQDKKKVIFPTPRLSEDNDNAAWDVESYAFLPVNDFI